MAPPRLKLIQLIIALALFGCMSCPFVEILLHWNGSIFVTGHDTESTAALLFLLIELSFAIAKVLASAVRAILRKLGIIAWSSNTVAISLIFSNTFPTISPPASLLRI